MSDNNETEPKRKGPGDCLTPTATIGALLIMTLWVLWHGASVVWAAMP